MTHLQSITTKNFTCFYLLYHSKSYWSWFQLDSIGLVTVLQDCDNINCATTHPPYLHQLVFHFLPPFLPLFPIFPITFFSYSCLELKPTWTTSLKYSHSFLPFSFSSRMFAFIWFVQASLIPALLTSLSLSGFVCFLQREKSKGKIYSWGDCWTFYASYIIAYNIYWGNFSYFSFPFPNLFSYFLFEKSIDNCHVGIIHYIHKACPVTITNECTVQYHKL